MLPNKQKLNKTRNFNVYEIVPVGKWMIEFLGKSESRGITIDRVNSIRITKLQIYFNFLHAVASRWRHQEDSFSKELTCYNQFTLRYTFVGLKNSQLSQNLRSRQRITGDTAGYDFCVTRSLSEIKVRFFILSQASTHEL